jgi:hypothetical protein
MNQMELYRCSNTFAPGLMIQGVNGSPCWIQASLQPINVPIVEQPINVPTVEGREIVAKTVRNNTIFLVQRGVVW